MCGRKRLWHLPEENEEGKILNFVFITMQDMPFCTPIKTYDIPEKQKNSKKIIQEPTVYKMKQNTRYFF